ncbi:hypothetical protein TNCV_3366801 [Trichonephila clavipes]|nr:hypothetical protein TNCV_3366801 [Trichonephila clavipes]
MVGDVAARSMTTLHTIRCPHRQWFNDMSVIGHMSSLFSSASKDVRSALKLLEVLKHLYIESNFFPGLLWEVVALSKLAIPDKVETCPDTGNYKYASPEASAEESCL